MNDCCRTDDAAVPLPGRVVVAFAGNPNVGKSTLFNRLTGARQRVINAPRTTVEVATGTWVDPALPGGAVLVLDLPGAYDLAEGSPDEKAAAAALHAGPGERPHLAVVFVDATAVGRSLYLLGQVALASVPVVVAVTMEDVAARRGAAPLAESLAAKLHVPVVAIDPRGGTGVEALAAVVAAALARPITLDIGDPDTCDPVEWAHLTARAVVGATPPPVRTASDRIDAALLRPWVGIPVFLAMLWGTFQLVTTAAAPLIDGVDGWWAGTVLTAARSIIPGDGWWEAATVDGILAGVGTVLSFAPLMALAFLAFALLEDSGYLARAAFVADKALRLIGLDGRATVPLVLGFGCNLPALAALKVLPNARQRLAAGLLIPFTSCAARLPVYLLLGAAFFPRHTGTAVFLLYLASAITVIGAGLIAKRTLLKADGALVTVTMLPAYQRPRLRSLLASTATRVKAFVTQAGTVIVIALGALWLLAAVPVTSDSRFGEVAVEDSLYAASARAITPVFAPAGFDDWRATSALATGLVAKELVVAAFAQSYALAEEPSSDFDAALRATFDASSGGHAEAAAAAFLAFVLLYSPCVATLGELKRQFGLRWMGVSMGVGLGAAYGTAVVVFQVGRLL